MHIVAIAAALALAATPSLAQDASGLRVVQHNIERRKVTDPVGRDRRRLLRRQTVNAVLDNEALLYYANMTIGTPSQSLRLHIDTGSSDLWVNTPTSRFCQQYSGQVCAAAGTFNPNTSSTYTYLNSLFQIQYADGSSASGDYVTDNVGLGGATLNGLQFAIGYSSNSQEGVLGIGYMANEAILSNRRGSQYANLPQKMLNQGLIKTNAYSLWLNDLDASTGNILFGGVNTEKFKGSLSTLPIIQRNGVYAAFYIALTGVGTNGNVGSIANNLQTAVLLDSGSSLSYLPDAVANSIYTQLGITYDSTRGAAIIDCSRATDGTTFQFTFSGVTINVDMSELVITIAISRSGRTTCIFGIASAGSSVSVLGDTFLRSAYVVYDLSNNQIALAQTNFNSTTDNILEITNTTSSSNGIPQATGVANAVSTVAVNPTGGARIGTGTTTNVGGAAPTRAPGTFAAVGLALAAAGVVAAGL